jgi:RNA polymerase sigma factor (sigma-70 family)
MNRSVSHFTLFECLYDDDFSAIYQAENNLSHQKVLLKLLNPNLIEREEIKNVIVEAIKTLPEKEKKVIVLYYYEDLTLKEIGEVLEVTESRISQLHTKAVMRLRSKLGKVKSVVSRK